MFGLRSQSDPQTCPDAPGPLSHPWFTMPVMGLHLWDLLDRKALDDALRDGYVSVRRSAEDGLRVFGYTPQTAYEGAWSPTTLACRGLVADEAGMIVARPFPKFFGQQEPHAPAIPAGVPVHVADKLDGSLGIAFKHEGETRISTRGSLDSEQSAAAENIWRAKYRDVELPEGATPLFEIIYPENRVVIDYGWRRDLVLLAVIDIESGKDLPLHSFGWTGPVAETSRFESMADAQASLAAQSADGRLREGHVIRFDPPDSAASVRVKVKTPEYLELHRARCHLNPRRVWAAAAVEAVAAHCDDSRRVASQLRIPEDDASARLFGPDSGVEGLRRRLPEEFWLWFDAAVGGFRDRADGLTRRYRKIVLAASSEAAVSPDGADRAFAAAARRLAADAGLHPGPCFGLRRGQWTAHAEIWRAVRPSGGRSEIAPGPWAAAQ